MIIGITIFISSIIFGLLYTKKLKNEKEKLNAIKDFNSNLQLNLSYYKDNLLKYIKNYKNEYLNEFFNEYSKKIKDTSKIDYKKYFSFGTKEIQEYFCFLGKSDEFSQRIFLDNFNKKLDLLLENYEIKNKNKIALLPKLSFLFGGAMLVILI